MTAIISANKELSKNASKGSALILTVVLTSLLAIVGVMFLMISRIDKMATSSISEDKQLDVAVDTIVAKISAQLVWDVPGVNIPGRRLPEYHDYPGPEDRWLACSEPYQPTVGGPYFWRHISDIYDKFDPYGANLRARIIPDYQNSGIMAEGLAADADGDGIADANWVIVPGITSSKGKPIYAAVRVTDNGGKINVNTAFQFDPCSPDMNYIDGTSLWHINLMALANRPGVTPTLLDETALLEARANYGALLDPNNLDMYEDNVSWRYSDLVMPYTPFDISDELELRNRFLLNQRREIHARIEHLGGWPASFRHVGFRGSTLHVPIGQGGSSSNVADWFARANESVDRLALPADNRYDYRHIATTYSTDRIIDPCGLSSSNNGRMVNVNTDNRFVLMDAISDSLQDANSTLTPAAADRLAAQIAVNVQDYRDDNNDVSWVADPNGPGYYYGYERPCIYISEIAGRVTTHPTTGADLISYAVELHKPYFEDGPPIDTGGSLGSDWKLVIGPNTFDINWTGSRRYHVILFQEDPNGLKLLVNFVDPEEVLYAAAVPGYTPVAAPYAQEEAYFSLEGATISLQRPAGIGGIGFTVDSNTVPTSWLTGAGPPRSFRRDITRHKCIRRLWDSNSVSGINVTLGSANGYVHPDANMVQAHPYLDPAFYTDRLTRTVGFKNVGEIGMVFDVSGYNVPIGSTDDDLRLDFRDPQYAKILNYLTVFDPRDHGNPGETKVKGRININTAPPFVLKQLPWIAPPAVGSAIVDMVVAYRDKLLMPGGPPFTGRFGNRGFESIGELMQVWTTGYAGYYGMDYYGVDGIDQDGFPDLTPLKLMGGRDGAPDDIEERDLIFQRISNLVTVRSDVFTAYILVRIGIDGPQRRVLAILDRSDVAPVAPDPLNPFDPPYTTGKVKIRALHKLPDPW